MAGNLENHADILNDDMCRRALNRAHSDIVAKMDPDVVFYRMKNCGMLSQNEYDDLMNFMTPKMKIRTLVSKISQQDKKAYFDFKKCLSDTKHEDLVKKLEEKEKELITENKRLRLLKDGRQREPQTARCEPEENSFPHDGRLVRLTMKMIDEFKQENVSKKLDDNIAGSYGTIYISHKKVPWLDRRAVLKEINVAEAQKTITIGAARNEIIASRLMHFAIVPLLAFHNDGSKYYLLTPYLENGDLHEAIKDDFKCMSDKDLTKLKMNCDTRVKVMYHIASAIDYMHSGNTYRRRILHQDIKSKNIVLDQHFNARLIDFGMARELKENETSFKTTTSETTRTTQDDYCQFGEVLLELIVNEDYTAQNRQLAKEYITEDLLLENIQEDVWNTSDIKDIVGIALKCIKHMPVDHSDSPEGLVTKFKSKARKSSALWNPVCDKKCEICLVNDQLDERVDCHDVDCLPQRDCSEKIKICCPCMRNSYINPIICHTCGWTIKPFINSDFGAILVAGYENPTESVYKEDIRKFKEVVTSKVLPTMCLSPENVIVVAETGNAENNTAIKQLDEAFENLAKKKIKTLLFVYSGHKSKTQGCRIGKDEFFTIDYLGKSIEKGKAQNETMNKVIVFLDCCYPEYVHLDPTLSLKLMQLNATGQSEEAHASISGSQFLKYVMQAFTSRANGGTCKDLDCKCGELLNGDFITLDDLRSYINTHIKSKSLTGILLHQQLHNINEKDIILCFNYKHPVKFEFTLAWLGSLELTVTACVFPEEFKDDFTQLKQLKHVLTSKFMERVSSIRPSDKDCDIIAATMCIETNTGPKEGDVEEINDLTEMLLAWNSKRLLRFKPRLVSNIEETKPVGWWFRNNDSALHPGNKIHLSQHTEVLKQELLNILTNNRLVKEDLRKYLQTEVHVLIGKVQMNKFAGMCLEIKFLNLTPDVKVCYFNLVPTAGIQETS
ncbi:uncharacterized protein LOC127850872 isoform X2 [Dreissena polymorpha]|uniref:uncharacterized protein LOC127850872 isoform X2 n=1 Tax=Dreissena polymorpha TaxID=45954 RepID=UPI002263FAAA|nr:uncharacterized protein LOC127850872 isoform X2 [Dreissena polymorpha]